MGAWLSHDEATPRGGVFGRPLHEAAARNQGAQVPAVVTMCISWVERHALKEEGLYRIPGSALRISQLQELVDSGELQELPSSELPENVCGLLTQFLHSLPEPLFTDRLEDAFVAVQVLPERERLVEVVRLVGMLPPPNRDTLRALVHHCVTVGTHARDNRMTADNLALCLFPSVLHAFTTMLKHADDVFPLPVFGQPLADVAARTDPRWGLVPSVVQQCVAWLEEHALLEEGLYRIPGSSVTVQQYRDAYDRGEEVALPAQELAENVCSLLKRFVQELPEPLLTRKLLPALRSAQQLPLPERLPRLRLALARLPPAHRATAFVFFRHLHRVSQHADSNRMSPNNLALSMFPHAMAAFETLVLHVHEVFGVPSDSDEAGQRWLDSVARERDAALARQTRA